MDTPEKHQQPPPSLASLARDRANLTVRRASRTFILGLPLINLVLLLVEMAFVAQIARRYDAYFDSRPVLTMMVTNSILNAIADTVAQSVTVLRQNSSRNSKTEKFSHELDEKLPHHGDELISTHLQRPPPFDYARTVRFAAWGFLIAPVQFRWLKFLQSTFPLKGAATSQAVKRMVLDQSLFAPAGLVAFFTYMAYAEGGGQREAKKRLSERWAPTLKANYILWPAVQLLNFRVVPLQFQLPFASTVGIAWGTYLSLSNSQGSEK